MIKQIINLLIFLSLAGYWDNYSMAQSQTNDVNFTKDIHECSISISTKKKLYESGEPISIIVELKNVGAADLFVERGGFARYDFTVLFNDKEHVPHTLYGKKILERKQIGSLAMLDLKPGEKTSMEFPLSRLFDFSLSGYYEISVTRKIKDPVTKTWLDVTSNKIEINVDDSFTAHAIE
jgi:hypothetical protein